MHHACAKKSPKWWRWSQEHKIRDALAASRADVQARSLTVKSYDPNMELNHPGGVQPEWTVRLERPERPWLAVPEV